MDRAVYARLAEQEDRHWRFRGRREVLASLLARFMPKALAPQLLEVGCGTGGNLGLLQRFGAVRTLLFPLVVAARFAKKALRRDTADDEMPGPLVNGALRRIFSLERRLVGRVPIPIGSSLYLVAE